VGIADRPVRAGRRPLGLGGARAFIALALLAIVALGAGLRFWNLGLVRHNYDDSYPAYDALHLLDGHQLLLSGQASSSASSTRFTRIPFS